MSTMERSTRVISISSAAADKMSSSLRTMGSGLPDACAASRARWSSDAVSLWRRTSDSPRWSRVSLGLGRDDTAIPERDLPHRLAIVDREHARRRTSLKLVKRGRQALGIQCSLHGRARQSQRSEHGTRGKRAPSKGVCGCSYSVLGKTFFKCTWNFADRQLSLLNQRDTAILTRRDRAPRPGPPEVPNNIKTISRTDHTSAKTKVYGSINAITEPMPALGSYLATNATMSAKYDIIGAMMLETESPIR